MTNIKRNSNRERKQENNNENMAVIGRKGNRERDRKVQFISPLPAGCPERWLKKAPVPSVASLAAATGGKGRRRE